MGETNQTDTLDFRDFTTRVEVIYENNSEYLDTALDRALADIATAVKQFNKQGEISLNLKIKPVNDRQVTVAAELKAKYPKPSAAASTMFINSRGKLVADDPRQEKLPGMNVVGMNK